ncbi:hypothetical protein IGI04_003941 [Brassica rapa subsp. trilocularis]|uniref:Uncharacterized protein n=1 Tax=Brassica rapa subsp. trilocularis TaxID=1813537 RepID=A0ABQ7NZV8_BRACM|nr:hypothetical protein IGI04_003941 [Brassica rapa subsp. trilocularis]
MFRCRDINFLPLSHRLPHNISIQDGTSIVRLHGYADLVPSHISGSAQGRVRHRSRKSIPLSWPNKPQSSPAKLLPLSSSDMFHQGQEIPPCSLASSSLGSSQECERRTWHPS